MNSEQFTMWLHGFFEISGSNSLTEKQVQIIKDHLDLVFKKVTPDYSKDDFIKNTPKSDEFVPWKDYKDNHIIPLTPYHPWEDPNKTGKPIYPWNETEIIC